MMNEIFYVEISLLLIQSLLATNIIEDNTEKSLIIDTESEEDMTYNFKKCKRRKLYNQCNKEVINKEEKHEYERNNSKNIAASHFLGAENTAFLFPNNSDILQRDLSSRQESQILLPSASIQNFFDNPNPECSRRTIEFSLSIENMFRFYSNSTRKIEYIFVKMCEELHLIFSVNEINFLTSISQVKLHIKRLELYERSYCHLSSENDLAWMFEEIKKLIVFQWNDFKKSPYISYFPELFGFSAFIQEKYILTDLKPFHLFRNLLIIHIISSRSRETIEKNKRNFSKNRQLYQNMNRKRILSDQETLLSFLILFFESFKYDNIIILNYLSFRSKLISGQENDSLFTNIPLKKVYFDLFFMLDFKEYIKIQVFLLKNSINSISNKKIFSQISCYLSSVQLNITRLDIIKWIVMYKAILIELRSYIKDIDEKIVLKYNQKEFLVYYDLFIKCLNKILTNNSKLDCLKILRISAKFYKSAIKFLWNVMFEKICFDFTLEYRNEIHNLLYENGIVYQ